MTEDQIERNQKLKIIGKAIMPSEQEIAVNSRSRSAVLRVAEVIMIFNRYDRYPLWRIIVDDIFQANKTVMLLLIALLISAVSTIWVTHLTRLAISERISCRRNIKHCRAKHLICVWKTVH